MLAFAETKICSAAGRQNASREATKVIRRALRGVLAVSQQAASCYGTRIFARQQTDLIFGLLYLLLCARYGLRSAILFCLSNVQHRCGSALLLNPDQPQRFLARSQGAFCNAESHILFEKAEVCCGDVADQGCDDRLAVPIRGQ